MSKQESIETRIYREQQAQNAKMRKGWRCDLCGRQATDCHEILFRSATMNNEEARRLSFQEPLLAILCNGCHSKAHSLKVSEKLLMHNSKIYGRDAVNEAFKAVQAVMKSRLMQWLDEDEEEVIDG